MLKGLQMETSHWNSSKGNYGMPIWLVVEPTHLKNMLVKLGSSSPRFGVKIKTYLKPPPSYNLDIPSSQNDHQD